MDGHQFDQLARVVASGTSRRRFLGLMASGLAAIGVQLRPQIARAGCGSLEIPVGESCEQNPCCIAGSECVGGVCQAVCAGANESCGSQTEGAAGIGCCDGLVCIDGTCLVGEPLCVPTGEQCSSDTNTQGLITCCDKGVECIDGICQFPEPDCGNEGDPCLSRQGGDGFICCNEGLECIDGVCQVPCGGVGDTEFECCDGLICVDGACAEPEPLCSAEGEPCKGDSDCCDDLVCGESGTCETLEPTCLEPGDTCTVDDDCCTGICCGGTCADIECCVDDENPNDRCDEGTSCFEGICEGVAELCEDDSTCGTGTCCCDDGSCSEDCCDPPVEEEEEPVTQLPNTGSGATGARISSWIGATAIGAAAAAFLGGKQIKPASKVESED